jgi:serine/threonine protein kinase
MHENNLAHLDIKPENILINKKGDFKICDFGRASLIDCEERHIFNEVLEGDRRYLAM